jgi:hypothetical protein
LVESTAVVSSVEFERVCDDTLLPVLLSSLVFVVEVGTMEAVEGGETLKEGSTYPPLYQCCVAWAMYWEYHSCM